jgi:hypothetical protein
VKRNHRPLTAFKPPTPYNSNNSDVLNETSTEQYNLTNNNSHSTTYEEMDTTDNASREVISSTRLTIPEVIPSPSSQLPSSQQLNIANPVTNTGARPKSIQRRNNHIDESLIINETFRSSRRKNDSVNLNTDDQPKVRKAKKSSKNTNVANKNNRTNEEESMSRTLGLQTSLEAALGATGGVYYAEDHPPQEISSISPISSIESLEETEETFTQDIPSNVPALWREPPKTLSERNKALKKVLEANYQNQLRKQKIIKEKQCEELEKKRDLVRKETWELISKKQTKTMRCPDCQKYQQRGGGLVTHRLNYCPKSQIKLG